MSVRRSWLHRVFALLVPLFVAAGVHAALPPGVTQGPSVEGITEYRLANGLTVLLFPDASKAKTTVNVTYRVGSRARELRRDRDGAPARAPRVQGHAQPRQRDGGTGPTRHELQRHDELGSHQLFRIVHFVRREPQVGAGDGSRPDGELVHPPQRPRLRDDRRAQRVRERREQPAARAVRQDAVDVLPVAQLRQPADRRALGHRERRHRPPAGVLQALLPAGQRGADRRGQVRPGRDARDDREVLRADPEAFAQAARDLHAGARPGRRAHGDAAARRQFEVPRR